MTYTYFVYFHQVKLWYDVQNYQLVVTVINAIDLQLPATDKPRNPYCKLYLLPDRRSVTSSTMPYNYVYYPDCWKFPDFFKFLDVTSFLTLCVCICNVCVCPPFNKCLSICVFVQAFMQSFHKSAFFRWLWMSCFLWYFTAKMWICCWSDRLTMWRKRN